MNCVNHPVRQGVNTCSKCGSWLCDECAVDIDGRIICKGCISKMAGHREHCHSEHRHKEHHGSCSGHKSYPNILLTLMFSCLPGLNYMYIGLIKRGLFVMSMFFLCAYLSSSVSIIGFAIPLIFFTSFFDGLRIRRRIIAGEPICDTIDDIKAFVSENKGAFMVAGIIVLVLTAMSGVSHMFRGFYWGMYHHSTSGIVALALILLGIHFFVKSKKKAPARTEEFKDYRDEQ